MHRLTQAILRSQLTSGGSAIMKEAAGTLLSANYPGTENTASSWPGWVRLLPQLLALARDPVARGNPTLRAMTSEAASYLVRRGDTQAGRELARSLY
jgi:hypothetical protein